MRFQFQFRRRTTDEWAADDDVLAEGEPGLELDDTTGEVLGLRIGDGTTPWSGLTALTPDGVGGSGAYLLHDQTTPTASITVTHNFGRHPAVQVLVDGVEVISDVEHPSVNEVSFVFPAPTAFMAIITA